MVPIRGLLLEVLVEDDDLLVVGALLVDAAMLRLLNTDPRTAWIFKLIEAGGGVVVIEAGYPEISVVSVRILTDVALPPVVVVAVALQPVTLEQEAD
jgi:hypothetical protein